MKNKKSILCIMLAVLMIGTAIGFAVYSSTGTTFDYGSGKMGQYLNIKDQNAVLKLWKNVKDVEEWKAATDEDVQYAVATTLKAISEKVTSKDSLAESGKLDEYDYLRMGYVVYTVKKNADGKPVDKDGNVITVDKDGKPSAAYVPDQIVSDRTYMNMTAAVSSMVGLQLNADDEFSKMLTAELLGMDFKKFRVFNTGKVYENDTLWVTATVTEYKDGTKGTETSYVYKKVAYKDLDAVLGVSGLKQDFADWQTSLEEIHTDKTTLLTTFGQTFKKKAAKTGESKEVSLTVHFAARATISSGDMKDGDVVTFTYKKSGDSSATPMIITIGDKAGFKETYKTMDEKFYDELVKKGKYEDQTISYLPEGKTEEKDRVNYTIDFDYALPQDPATDDRAEIDRPENMSVMMGLNGGIKYPEDSKVTARGDNNKEMTTGTDQKKVELKGETVIVEVFMSCYVDAGYGTIKTLVKDLLSLSNEQATIKSYLDKYEAYQTALAAKKDSDEETVKAYDEALTALVSAEKSLRNLLDIEDNRGEDKADEHDPSLLENKTVVLAAYIKACYKLILAEEDLKKDSKQENVDAVNTAKEAVVKAEKKYCSVWSVLDPNPESHDTDIADRAATEAYKLLWKNKKDAVQASNSSTRRYAIAKAMWNELLKLQSLMVKYPTKALDLVETGLIDSYEASYYAATDKANYKDFDDYLARVTFKSEVEAAKKKDANVDVDTVVENAIDAKVKQIVFENVLLYRLCEIFKVTLTEEQAKTLEDYQDSYDTGLYGDFQIGSPSIPISISGYQLSMPTESEAAYLFDNLMELLTEKIDKNITQTEAK